MTQSVSTHQIGKADAAHGRAAPIIQGTKISRNYSSAAKQRPHTIGRVRVIVARTPRSSRWVVSDEDEPQGTLRVSELLHQATTTAAAAAAAAAALCACGRYRFAYDDAGRRSTLLVHGCRSSS